MLVAGGETTLEVRGPGQGGRNQEFALIIAQELAGTEGLCVLAAGTDGTDGPTEAAGGIVDAGTAGRIRRTGADPSALLADNDSHRALSLASDLLLTGATGTNVADVQVLLLGPRGPRRNPVRRES
jgi:hydroxypyruvate reductase